MLWRLTFNISLLLAFGLRLAPRLPTGYGARRHAHTVYSVCLTGPMATSDQLRWRAQFDAFEPFMPDDFTTSGEGYEVRGAAVPGQAPPHDLVVGQPISMWFGSPYNKWYAGKVKEINKKR